MPTVETYCLGEKISFKILLLIDSTWSHERSAVVAEIARELELEVKAEDVIELLQAHDKNLDKVLLFIDGPRKWFLEVETAPGEDAVKIVEMTTKDLKYCVNLVDKQQGFFLFSQKPLSWAACNPETETCRIYFCMISILVVYSGRVNLIHANPSFRNNSLFSVLSHLFACYKNIASLCLVQLFCFFKDMLKYDLSFEAFFCFFQKFLYPSSVSP